MSDIEFEYDEIEAWVDDLNDARKRVLRHRLEMATEHIFDEEERERVANSTIIDMYLTDLFIELEEEGSVKPDHIDEDGQIIYVITDRGHERIAAESA